MFYDVSFTIPANTTKASPLEQHVKLTHGIIQRVEIIFPPGCVGMVHLQIKEALHQLWPNNPEGSFNGDTFPVAFDEHLEFTREPYIITLVGWSPDTTYSHTLGVKIGILPVNVLMSGSPFVATVRRVTERLGL